MTVVLVVLALGACWRLGRLAAVDEIARPVRERVVSRYGPSSWQAYLVTCSWCISVWTSVPVAAAVVWFPTNRAVWAGLIVLCGSLAAGFGQTVEDRLDR